MGKTVLVISCFLLLCLCSAAPAAIVIEDNGLDKTYNCKGDRVVIDGSRNAIRLTGWCKEVSVDGDSNDVSVESVTSIDVDGRNNKVIWSEEVNGKPPRITSDGSGNVVERAGGAHPRTMKQDEKGAGVVVKEGEKEVAVGAESGGVVATDGESKVTVGAQGSGIAVTTDEGKTVTIGGSGQAAEVSEGEHTTERGGDREPLTLMENGLHATYDCDGRSVTVMGNQCSLRLRGECNTVSVPGNHNTVSIEAAKSIVLAGNHNDVTWKRGINGVRPRINNPGTGNTVKQKD